MFCLLQFRISAASATFTTRCTTKLWKSETDSGTFFPIRYSVAALTLRLMSHSIPCPPGCSFPGSTNTYHRGSQTSRERLLCFSNVEISEKTARFSRAFHTLNIFVRFQTKKKPSKSKISATSSILSFVHRARKKDAESSKADRRRTKVRRGRLSTRETEI